MNQDQLRERAVQATIAQGKSLVRDASALVERTRRLFAELGIDPELEYNRLKDAGGDEAVLKAQAEFQYLIDGIDDEIRRVAMHVRPSAAPLRRRFNRV